MLDALFGVRLTYLLNGINFDDDIKSPKDFATHHLKVGTGSPYQKDLLSYIPEIKQYSPKDYLECYSTSSCQAEFHSKTLALLTLSRQMNYLKSFYNLGEYPERTTRSSINRSDCRIFSKGHPLFPLFNRHLKYLIESGITNRIIDKYSSPAELEAPSLESTQSLNFEHIVAPLLVLNIDKQLFPIHNRTTDPDVHVVPAQELSSSVNNENGCCKLRIVWQLSIFFEKLKDIVKIGSSFGLFLGPFFTPFLYDIDIVSHLIKSENHIQKKAGQYNFLRALGKRQIFMEAGE
ncbi:hypothetical protein HHI36_011150 [Cryptolaemus montrouzieri]|uniref:Uncharacterized protein n=1 Tax=Cryptolaemus montrouzieri TaxID=559131 RepID=A0ABD2MKX9_9CUCU